LNRRTREVVEPHIRGIIIKSLNHLKIIKSGHKIVKACWVEHFSLFFVNLSMDDDI